MENTFWNLSTAMDGNFVELFKDSFSLYVESGTREKTVVAIDTLRYELGGHFITEDFKKKLLKIITEHYLRKFHCLFLYLTYLKLEYSPH